jgi:hypothetical protein
MLVTHVFPTVQAAVAELSFNAAPNANALQAAQSTAKTACGVVATVDGADIRTIQV